MNIYDFKEIDLDVDETKIEELVSEKTITENKQALEYVKLLRKTAVNLPKVAHEGMAEMEIEISTAIEIQQSNQ